MSKFELKNSALENKNYGTEDVKFLQSCNHTSMNPVFQKCQKENCSGKESSDSEEGTSRIGNTLWCPCGKYKSMATHVESICCLDKYEICESYFKGTLSFFYIYFFLSWF